jgi:TolB-like protein
VRVEAHRLRSKLQSYYSGAGHGDAVRIVFRKGSYAPTFESAMSVTPIPERSTVSRYWMISATLGLVAVVAAAWALSSHSGPPRRTVAVYPFTDKSIEAEFVNGLGEELSAQLARNPQLRVRAWPLVKEYARSHREPTGALIKDLGTESVLFVSVRRDGNRRRLAAYLVLAEGGSKTWVGEYERGASDSLAVQVELARVIADELGRTLSKGLN